MRWEGSPGKLNIARIGLFRVSLIRWNNLAPHNFYRRPGKWQLIVPLRRFKVGRKSLYLRVSWGYGRKV